MRGRRRRIRRRRRRIIRRRSGNGEAKSESVTHRPTFNPSTLPPPSRHVLKLAIDKDGDHDNL